MTVSERAATRLIEWSHELGQRLLAESEPDRWAHSAAVAVLAAELVRELRANDVVVAAANLHDIGYSPEVSRTGFHPLDGALHLQTIDAPPELCNLVAHHTSADDEAAVRGLASELAQFESPGGDLADLLTYCDLHTSPSGERVTVASRMDEICERYEPSAPAYLALVASRNDLLAAVARVEQRLHMADDWSR